MYVSSGYFDAAGAPRLMGPQLHARRGRRTRVFVTACAAARWPHSASHSVIGWTGDMSAGVNQTFFSIAAAWDMLSLEEKAVIFRQWVVAAFIAVEKIPGRKRGHPKHAVFYLAGTPRSGAEADDAAANASLISTITSWSVSADSEFSSAATAETEPTRPSAQAECDRTSGSESDSPDLNGGTAASSPQLPSATATFRRKPARPARRTGEPRENASQPDSSMDIRSTSDGASVPGCHPSESNGSTPTGGSPGPRAANDGSDEGTENLRLKGHTSWEECRLPRFVIPLPRGKRK
jgi:hypothetical protein